MSGAACPSWCAGHEDGSWVHYGPTFGPFVTMAAGDDQPVLVLDLELIGSCFDGSTIEFATLEVATELAAQASRGATWMMDAVREHNGLPSGSMKTAAHYLVYRSDLPAAPLSHAVLPGTRHTLCALPVDVAIPVLILRDGESWATAPDRCGKCSSRVS